MPAMPAHHICVVTGCGLPFTGTMRSQRSPGIECGKAAVAAFGHSSTSQSLKNSAHARRIWWRRFEATSQSLCGWVLARTICA